VARVAVFSANQAALLHEHLGLDPSRVSVVRFGVDTGYYDATLVDGSAGGGGLVAIGSDSRRDYQTLFDAVRIADVPLTLACQPRNVDGLDVPRQVTVRHDIYDGAYRDLLHHADLVVTPTVAPAYPSGQSVVLEAMAMGRATLTTDSPAMREYVDDGITGVLVAPRDPCELARSITELLADDQLRRSLGHAAVARVRERFDLGHLWQDVEQVILAATATDAPGADPGINVGR
jgi:glycosyltransferase involved in cell wall biosynthesis